MKMNIEDNNYYTSNDNNSSMSSSKGSNSASRMWAQLNREEKQDMMKLKVYLNELCEMDEPSALSYELILEYILQKYKLSKLIAHTIYAVHKEWCDKVKKLDKRDGEDDKDINKLQLHSNNSKHPLRILLLLHRFILQANSPSKQTLLTSMESYLPEIFIETFRVVQSHDDIRVIDSLKMMRLSWAGRICAKIIEKIQFEVKAQFQIDLNKDLLTSDVKTLSRYFKRNGIGSKLIPQGITCRKGIEQQNQRFNGNVIGDGQVKGDKENKEDEEKLQGHIGKEKNQDKEIKKGSSDQGGEQKDNEEEQNGGAEEIEEIKDNNDKRLLGESVKECMKHKNSMEDTDHNNSKEGEVNMMNNQECDKNNTRCDVIEAEVKKPSDSEKQDLITRKVKEEEDNTEAIKNNHSSGVKDININHEVDNNTNINNAEHKVDNIPEENVNDTNCDKNYRERSTVNDDEEEERNNNNKDNHTSGTVQQEESQSLVSSQQQQQQQPPREIKARKKRIKQADNSQQQTSQEQQQQVSNQQSQSSCSQQTPQQKKISKKLNKEEEDVAPQALAAAAGGTSPKLEQHEQEQKPSVKKLEGDLASEQIEEFLLESSSQEEQQQQEQEQHEHEHEHEEQQQQEESQSIEEESEDDEDIQIRKKEEGGGGQSTRSSQQSHRNHAEQDTNHKRQHGYYSSQQQHQQYDYRDEYKDRRADRPSSSSWRQRDNNSNSQQPYSNSSRSYRNNRRFDDDVGSYPRKQFRQGHQNYNSSNSSNQQYSNNNDGHNSGYYQRSTYYPRNNINNHYRSTNVNNINSQHHHPHHLPHASSHYYNDQGHDQSWKQQQAYAQYPVMMEQQSLPLQGYAPAASDPQGYLRAEGNNELVQYQDGEQQPQGYHQQQQVQYYEGYQVPQDQYHYQYGRQQEGLPYGYYHNPTELTNEQLQQQHQFNQGHIVNASTGYNVNYEGDINNNGGGMLNAEYQQPFNNPMVNQQGYQHTEIEQGAQQQLDIQQKEQEAQNNYQNEQQNITPVQAIQGQHNSDGGIEAQQKECQHQQAESYSLANQQQLETAAVQQENDLLKSAADQVTNSINITPATAVGDADNAAANKL